jgi:hypothetical protein
VILATGDRGQVSMFVHDTFGQRVFSPVGALQADAGLLSLHHDFEAIGKACAQYLLDAGCRNVLVLGRTGFAYSDSITDACIRVLRANAVVAQSIPGGDNAAVRLHEYLHEGVDGLLDLSAEPGDLQRGLLGQEVVARAPLPGQIVVLSNADGTDPSGGSASPGSAWKAARWARWPPSTSWPGSRTPQLLRSRTCHS